MFEILSLIPGKKKNTSKGWHSFNAPCCQYRGHKPDRRSRGGIIFDGQNHWSYHCFNCDFKCSFTLGKALTKNTKLLLRYLGIDSDQISRWNFESLQHKDLLDFTSKKEKRTKIKFDTVEIPESEILDKNNSKHKVYVDYLQKRGITIDEYPFLITPTAMARNKNRIIIPFTYKNKIVGYTSRFLDSNTPKYINHHQTGFVFGMDFQQPHYRFCIVVEGVFDAISINGCAVLHDTISNEQAELLGTLNRPVIVVPDQDKTGLELCERALSLGYNVSLPNWGIGIKDVNDAVIKYGKLATLLSILESQTTSRIKIQMRRKEIVKRL